MALGIQQLRSVARVATRIGLDMYDRMAGDLLPLMAQVVRPRGASKTQTLEWTDAFPMAREWVGERKVREVLGDSIEITLKAYEQTFKIDTLDLEMNADLALIRSPQELGAQVARGWDAARLEAAMAVFRTNAAAYDGQDFFDTDHTHIDGDTYSNLIDISGDANLPDRVATGVPTVAEAANELGYAITVLEANRLRLQTVVETKVPGNLVVIAHNFGVWNAYFKLMTQEMLADDVANPYRGTFRLLRDTAPTSGDEKKVDIILAEPGGPRPVIYMPFREPGALEVDDTDQFKHHQIFFGNDAIFGFAAGFPQTAVRIQE